jgi:hypothetical protein
MAIRKPRHTSQPNPEAAPKEAQWPYPVLRRTLVVHADGSVRIPAGFVRMVAAEGEEVTVTFLSDGHLELDSSAGRSTPPPHAPGSHVYYSDEEFLAALKNQMQKPR